MLFSTGDRFKDSGEKVSLILNVYLQATLILKDETKSKRVVQYC